MDSQLCPSIWGEKQYVEVQHGIQIHGYSLVKRVEFSGS
jgi:hypothetical protein